MDTKDREIDNLFREAYHAAREVPSEGVWGKLQASLDKADADKYRENVKFWKWIAMMLLCALTSLIIHEMNSSNLRRAEEKPRAIARPIMRPAKGVSPPYEHVDNDHQASFRSLPVRKWRNSIDIRPSRLTAATAATKKEIKYSFKLPVAFSKVPAKAFFSTHVENTDPLEFSLAWQAAGYPLVPEKKPAISQWVPMWTFTALGSRDWASYRLDNDVPENSGGPDEKEGINKRERHESSFSYGLMVSRRILKQWSVTFGFLYSKTSIMIDPQLMLASRQPDGRVRYKYVTSSGYAYLKPSPGAAPSVGDTLESAVAQHRLESISIPVMLSYWVRMNRITLIPSLGLTADWITRASVKTELMDASSRETVSISHLDGTKRFYPGLRAEFNLQYRWNRNWSLTMSPTFKYALSPITKNNVVKTYPYSFGAAAGITYTF